MLLPQTEERADAQRRKADALAILSQYEEREVSAVASDVRAIGFDIWRSIVPNALVRHEAIALSIAEKFIKSAKSLLASSATTEAKPKPFFERATKTATHFADDCRFAHTFRGSFGFSIEAPIVPNDSPAMPSIEENAPFERRVMQRLARGIANAALAAKLEDPAVIYRNFETGFSANMCESFVDMMDAIGGQNVGFEFSFSPEWRPASDVENQMRVEFSPLHSELVQDAARALRLQEFERNCTVVGRVVKLETESDPSDLFDDSGERQIAVQWSSKDFGNIRVLIYLPPPQYLAANEAHGRGQYVSVTGTIDRRGRRWVLLEPSDFKLLPRI